MSADRGPQPAGAAPKPDLIIHNAAQVLTCAAGSADGVGLVSGASVAVENGKIAKIAPLPALMQAFDTRSAALLDAAGGVVLPGFVDCHTHLVFGGHRRQEYVASLAGMGKKQMQRQGIGTGLAESMRCTNEATDDELLQSSLAKLRNMLRGGTTTAEIKSGYGMETAAELRQLRTIRMLRTLQPIALKATFLGAHGWPPGTRKQDYIDLLLREMIPAVGVEQLADFCDIWCDEGYYTAGECEQVLGRALQFGMRAKIHTGAYSYIGGADVAAGLGATSADHLNFTPEPALRKLAEAGVAGVLLPGTDFCVAHPRPVDPRPMIACGLITALGTNLNPGCWIESMHTILVLACRRHGMTPEQAIVAATRHGAMALGMQDAIGSLEVGKAADLQIWNTGDYRDAVYQIDRNPVAMVIKDGKVAYS